MKDFFKFMFASMVGFILSSILLFLIAMIIVASVVSMSTKNVVVIPQKSVLELKLNTPIPDRAPKTPTSLWVNSFGVNKVVGLDEILKNIEKAKKDDDIKGIYLELSVIPSGIGTVEEIRDKLLEFKESGKFIICYGEAFSQGAYYMATVADKIYLQPTGMLQFKGLNAEMMFFKGTLEKLDVDMQIIRPASNKFKSAVEPFFLDKMSDANREQTMVYITSVWDDVLSAISASRHISVAELNRLADSLLVRNGEDALKYKLVDGLYYKDQVMDELRKMLDIGPSKKISIVKLSKYVNVTVKALQPQYTPNKIAVIYALGAIQGGEGDDNTIGSDRMAKAIRQARSDSAVKAIVFRVNSPGGSALASDVIRREIELAKAAKPVIASYGSVAASGGYWISCMADKIIADKNSLTGSIGVFGMIPNIQGLMNNKLGITFDHAQTNTNASFPSVDRSLTPYEMSVLQFTVDDTYDQFLQLVSGARHLTVERVDEIAGGRIWPAPKAKEIGLIDEFGGLEKAVKVAAEAAGIEHYRLISLPKQKEPLQQIYEALTGQNDEQDVIKKTLGENFRYYQLLKDITQTKGVLARLPFEMTIY
jgi:protease-4